MSSAKSERVVTTATRLRSIPLDFADQGPDDRMRYLAEELQRALAPVPAGEHLNFLRELKLQLAAGDPSGPEEPAWREADGLIVDFLDATAAELAVEEQRAMLDHQPGPTSEEEAIDELCAVLHVPAATVDPVRAIQLAAMLAEFTSTTSKLAWATWRTIAPQSSVRHGGISQKALARFLAGDPGVTREQAGAELERLRQLIAALISAISQVGDQFARAHLDKFAPNEIENAVRIEGSERLFQSMEARCWRKYVELADALDHSAIESDIRAVISQHAEHLIRVIGRESENRTSSV